MYGEANSPVPPSERRAWLIALALLLLGAGVLAAVLAGAVGSSTQALPPPPAVLAAVRTPTPAGSSEVELFSGRGTVAGPYAGTGGSSRSPTATAGRARSVGAVVAEPHGGSRGGSSATPATAVHIPARWEAGFYPIYAQAQRVFGVNWLLLASIHMQESAFSTAPSTYHGLNFAGCCGGPMQFNVTNGPVTTWRLVQNAYRYGTRPAVYDHRTARHPSIYDDYDAVMAGAWLLSSDGARTALDDSAWWAAYDYYGHDATGIAYADEVLARAIGWSQHGFCINCGVETGLVQAVREAYGVPVAATLATATTARLRHSRHAHQR
jgi:hypothetical protein